MTPGSRTKEGYLYHEPAFPVKNAKFHRSDNLRRLEMLLRSQDWNGENVIDMGCNVGYFSVKLAMHGARVTGVDLDREAIAFGNAQINSYGIENCTLVAPDAERRYMNDKTVALAFSVIPWIYETEKEEAEKIINKLFAAPVAYVELMYPGDGRASVPGVTNDEEAKRWLQRFYTYVFKIGITEDDTDGVARRRTVWKCMYSISSEDHKVFYGSQAIVEIGREHVVTKRARDGKEYEPEREFAALEKLVDYGIAPAPIQITRPGFEMTMAKINGVPFNLDYVPKELAVKEFERLATALEQTKIRHNDVRPSNLIVGFDGHIHLLDFGWAQLTGEEYVPAGINPKFKGATDRESFEKILGLMETWK